MHAGPGRSSISTGTTLVAPPRPGTSSTGARTGALLLAAGQGRVRERSRRPTSPTAVDLRRTGAAVGSTDVVTNRVHADDLDPSHVHRRARRDGFALRVTVDELNHVDDE